MVISVFILVPVFCVDAKTYRRSLNMNNEQWVLKHNPEKACFDIGEIWLLNYVFYKEIMYTPGACVSLVSRQQSLSKRPRGVQGRCSCFPKWNICFKKQDFNREMYHEGAEHQCVAELLPAPSQHHPFPSGAACRGSVHLSKSLPRTVRWFPTRDGALCLSIKQNAIINIF